MNTGLRQWLRSKDSACNAGGENPLEETWQPTPVFLPGESHGERRLVGYVQTEAT